MAHEVGRDGFARGALGRACHPAGKCQWCGQQRTRLFSYVWVSDGSLAGQPSIVCVHQRKHGFCNFQCFESYHS